LNSIIENILNTIEKHSSIVRFQININCFISIIHVDNIKMLTQTIGLSELRQ